MRRVEILRGQYRRGERLPSQRDGATRTVPTGHVRCAHPLLDLNDVPKAGLVDPVLDAIATLLGVAARDAYLTWQQKLGVDAHEAELGCPGALGLTLRLEVA